MRSIPVDTSTGVVFQVLFMMGVRTTDGHNPGVYFSMCSRPTVEIPEPFPSKTNGKVAGPEYVLSQPRRLSRRVHDATFPPFPSTHPRRHFRIPRTLLPLPPRPNLRQHNPHRRLLDAVYRLVSFTTAGRLNPIRSDSGTIYILASATAYIRSDAIAHSQGHP